MSDDAKELGALLGELGQIIASPIGAFVPAAADGLVGIIKRGLFVAAFEQSARDLAKGGADAEVEVEVEVEARVEALARENVLFVYAEYLGGMSEHDRAAVDQAQRGTSLAEVAAAYAHGIADPFVGVAIAFGFLMTNGFSTLAPAPAWIRHIERLRQGELSREELSSLFTRAIGGNPVVFVI